MSIIPILNWNKMFEEEQRRYSKSEKSGKVVAKAKQNTNSEDSPTYSFEEHIYYKVDYLDPKLSSFFDILNKYGGIIDKIDKGILLEEFQGLCHLYEEKEKEVNERASELEKSGLTLCGDIRTEETYAPVKTIPGMGYAGVGEYSYTYRKTFAIGFNGIKITSEMLSNRMNIFDNLTEDQKKAISNYLEAINSCETIGEDIRQKIREYGNFSGYETADKRDKWQRAFDKMIEDGAVSQELIYEANSILNQEIQDKQDIYDEGEPECGVGPSMAQEILWYIKKLERSHHEENRLQRR